MKLKMNSNRILILFSALVLPLGFVNYYVNLLLAIVIAICFLKSSSSDIIQILIFLFPMAIVFKIPLSSVSLFTLLIFWANIIFLFRASVEKRAFLVLFFFYLYLFCVTKSFSLSALKIVTFSLFLYFFTIHYCTEFKYRYVYTYALGLIYSSFWGLFKNKIPAIRFFYDDINEMYFNGVKLFRFSALFDDPNYYSIAIVSCLCILSSCVRDNRNKKRNILLICVLSLFGFFTFSKSFYLIFVLFITYNAFAFGRIKHKLGIVFFFIIAFLLFFTNPFGVFDIIFERFKNKDSLNIRFEIWEGYLNEINSSLHNLFWGHGLEAGFVGTHSTHNMYLEIFYYLGIFGFILFWGCLLFILFSRKDIIYRKKELYSLLFILVMYFFLAGITGCDLPFYLIAVFISLDGGKKKGNLTKSEK